MKILSVLVLLYSLCSFAKEEPKLPSASIYQLDQEWTTQEGKKINLKDLRGAPAVITMIFTSCPGACPLMVSNMKDFDSHLKKEEQSKIKYFAFSIDPKNDTPSALKKFFEKMHLNERWTLLTSNEDQVKEMAAVLGFSYKYLGDKDFTHSTSLYMLSAQGEILSRKERSQDWKEFLEKFRAQLRKK
ncbi:MAG: SCO family protein [Pseudobdellovibrionaceae bacterium]